MDNEQTQSFSEQGQPKYVLAEVEKILETKEHIAEEGKKFYSQKLQVKLETGETLHLDFGSDFQNLRKDQLSSVGDRILVAEQPVFVNEELKTDFVFADYYRLPTIMFLFFAFVLAVIFIGKKKGFLSLLGLFTTFLVLIKFVIPYIVAGYNPVVISLFGSLVIASTTIYLSHGYNIKSHISLVSMMMTLAVVSAISYFAVISAKLFGMGSEEAYFIQFGAEQINLRGLLLGGIMLGALGVLDDVCVAQVSIVFQLKNVKEKISFYELYKRGFEVGKDHVASLVNTLVLAYAGTNMPLFILLINNQNVPTFVALNSEIIVEEIIRTLAGSIGLVLAVPLTTFIASFVALRLSKEALKKLDNLNHEHEEHGFHGHTH